MTTGVPELKECVPLAIIMVSPLLALAMRPDIPVGEQELFTPFVPQVYVAARAMLADPRVRHTLPKARHHLIHEISFIVSSPILTSAMWYVLDISEESNSYARIHNKSSLYFDHLTLG